MIDASVLGSSEALFILLKMSLEQPQGDQYPWRYEGLNVCTWTSLIICQGRAERERSDLEWSGVTPEW